MPDETDEDVEAEPGWGAPFVPGEVDEDLEQQPARGERLGALGQLFAALAAVVIVGLLLVGAAAALSWLFR